MFCFRSLLPQIVATHGDSQKKVGEPRPDVEKGKHGQFNIESRKHRVISELNMPLEDAASR